jgi:hypothetical protein
MFTLIGGNAKNSVDAVYVELTNLLGYESPYVEYFNKTKIEIYGGEIEYDYDDGNGEIYDDVEKDILTDVLFPLFGV